MVSDGFLWVAKCTVEGKFMEIIKYLQPFVVGPWVVIGDFNAYLHASEKMSARQPQFSQIEAFREALSSCQLHDLGFKGYSYTWINKRPGEANTKIRLDRGGCQ